MTLQRLLGQKSVMESGCGHLGIKARGNGIAIQDRKDRCEDIIPHEIPKFLKEKGIQCIWAGSLMGLNLIQSSLNLQF